MWVFTHVLPLDSGVVDVYKEGMIGNETINNISIDQLRLRPELIWEQVCEIISQEISSTTYKAWMSPHNLTEVQLVASAAGDELDSLIAVISSPSSFHANKFEIALGERVKDLMEERLEKPVKLSFSIKMKIDPEKSIDNYKAVNLKSEQYKRNPEGMGKKPTLDDMRLFNEKLKAKSLLESKKATKIKGETDSLFSETVIQSVESNRTNALARASGLKPDFTFDTFAVSSSNEMAHAAAIAVSNKPGVNYNPLFLYGGVGVGKTHLMHAIANNILKNNPSFKVIYCTGEEFTNEIIRAIQNKRTLGFKDKFRSCQVLLIDDVQFLAGKNAVQEEFFHTFNTLVKHNSQIILTSDRSPQEISLLEDRLRSRFEAGLVVDIQQPSFELRTAILLIKTAALNINLSMDFAQMIAAQVDSARKIEGVIKKLQSEVELKNKLINKDMIASILVEEIREQKVNFRLTANDILNCVAKHYKIKPTTIKGIKRNRSIVLARHVSMYLFKSELNYSYVEIGKWFGASDHTSSMHAVKKIVGLLNTDEQLQFDISEIKLLLVGL